MNTQDARYLAASLRGDLPAIDLHGIQLLTQAEEQLESQLFLFSSRGEDVCRVIHGIGSGSMKETVHAVLKKNPMVDEFIMSEDGGSTVVLF